MSHRAARRRRQLNAGPGRFPSALRIDASGQNPVNADWNRLAPTKAVSHNQARSWYTASARLARIMNPAKARTIRSMVMGIPPFGLFIIILLFSYFATPIPVSDRPRAASARARPKGSRGIEALIADDLHP